MDQRMSTNLKYFQLLAQIEKNPLKSKVAAAVDIVADFALDTEAVGLDRRLSPEGKRDKAQGNLKKALRDLRDVRKTALDEYHAMTETMRGTVERPAYDKSDYASALRRELRDAARVMSLGQRAALMSGPARDVNFIDAVLEQPAWVSGINTYDPGELALYEGAKAERLRDLHAPLLDAIAERDAVESEAQMILDVARGDIAADSGLQSREFADVCKQIESGIGAPWTKKTTKIDGTEQVILFEPQPDGTVRNRPATPDEARDGREYADLQSYLASRAA
jgi:hypothetical protein